MFLEFIIKPEFKLSHKIDNNIRRFIELSVEYCRIIEINCIFAAVMA